jgi:hypothetical protein
VKLVDHSSQLTALAPWSPATMCRVMCLDISSPSISRLPWAPSWIVAGVSQKSMCAHVLGTWTRGVARIQVDFTHRCLHNLPCCENRNMSWEKRHPFHFRIPVAVTGTVICYMLCWKMVYILSFVASSVILSSLKTKSQSVKASNP